MTGILSRSLAESVKDPAPSWMWMFTVIGVSGVSFVNPLYVTEASIGFRALSRERPLWGGAYAGFPSGPSDYPTLSLTFYEDHRYYATTMLDQWSRQVMTKHNYVGLPKDYCGTGYLVAMDSQGFPVIEITIKGMWPIEQSGLDFGQESTAIQRRAVFNYNDISFITEGTAASSLLNEVGLSGGGLAGNLAQSIIGGGLTLIPGT